MTRAPLVFICAALAGAAACSVEDPPPAGPPPYEGPPIPWDYAPFPKVVAPKDNPITDAKASLGMLLFYDPILSSDQKVACVTCHSEQWGMSDGLPLSVGVDGAGAVGPGRTGPNMTTRNAMTLWNVALRTELFWDGRTPSLEQQAMEPLKQPKEMNLLPEDAAARVAAVAAYVPLFDAAFPGESITPENIAKAIATFERTLVTNRSPYDRYVGGDAGAMSEDQMRGMQLFADSGCASCHAPPLFEAREYVRRLDTTDEGRFAITGVEADRGAFRVPTLRNLRESGPYFHDGSAPDVASAIRAEVERGVAEGTATSLDDAQVADIAAFLENALMERLHNPIRPEAVPSGLEIPLDGFRIPR